MNINKCIAILSIIGFLGSGVFVSAQTSPEVEEALTNTKESVNDLVTAKDENDPLNLSFRIKTFEDVISLATAEAEGLKIKLLTIETEDENIRQWKEGIVAKINGILNYYEETQNFIAENKTDLNLEILQEKAKEFKNWREKNYLETREIAQTFVFLNKENNALEIAEKRWIKINKDLEVLEQHEIITSGSDLWLMFNKARNYINTGEEKNRKAMEMFYKNYIKPEKEMSEEQNSTSTENNASTTNVEIQNIELSENSNTEISTSTPEGHSTTTSQNQRNISATTTQNKVEPNATTTKNNINTETDSEVSKPISSIKDLANNSLESIRETYRVFIEMSDLVRKLLK